MNTDRLATPGALLMALLAAALLGACAAPPLEPLAAPRSSAYTPSPLPETDATLPLPSAWWTLLGHPGLDALVQQALAAHPSVQATDAALRAAQHNLAAQRAAVWPSAQLGYSPQRGKVAAVTAGNPPTAEPLLYSFHSAQLSVGYTADVFGGTQAAVRGAEAQLQLQQAQAQAARLTLASLVAGAAIQDAQLREQLGLLDEQLGAAEQALALLQRQWQAGSATRLDVAQQQAQLAQQRQLRPPLQRQLAQNQDLLQQLLGREPSAPGEPAPPAFRLADFKPPARLPLSLPSALLAQRPDLRAAAAQWQSAAAAVGVAHAARLPQFSISATAGGGAAQFGGLLAAPGRFFTVAASLAQPLFDAGALREREAGAVAALQQADAQYRNTLLLALQNVADSLQALHSDGDALAAARQAEQATADARALMQRQQAAGYADRLALLQAVQQHDQAALSRVQAQAAQLADSVALLQALGGAWE